MKIHTLLLTSLLGYTGLHAKVIYVDSASAGGSGQSWGDAFPTLVEGLADAEAGDEIRVAVNRQSLVFDPNEGWAIDIFPHQLASQGRLPRECRPRPETPALPAPCH